MKITTELVKKLRNETGVSVMQCKNALEEADGDMEKAMIILKKKSSNIADKKAHRNAKEGVIVILENQNKALLLTLRTETDFVAKNEDFTTLANSLAKFAFDQGIEKMKEQSLEMINPVVQKVGEKIELGTVTEINGNVLGSYVHGGKNGVIVSLEGGDKNLARDIAMHITAMKPKYISKEDISSEDKAKVVEVFKKEVDKEDKPENIKEKILNGKISSYFKEITLNDQKYIKNPNQTIEQLLKENKAKLINFVRESI